LKWFYFFFFFSYGIALNILNIIFRHVMYKTIYLLQKTNQWTSFKPVSRPENQTQTGFFAIKTPIEYTGRELIFTEFQLSQNGTSNMSTQEYLDQFLRIHLTSFKLNNKIISLHIPKKHSSR
jgi:hypothetical protein